MLMPNGVREDGRRDRGDSPITPTMSMAIFTAYLMSLGVACGAGAA
jgi:hypothetical protein